MHFPPGMLAVAVLSGLVAAGATASLAASARRRGGPHRPAYALLAAAAGGALLSLLAGLTGALSVGDHWAHEQGQRTGWATLVSAGTTISGVAVGVALLRLLGAAATRAATARLLLDGLIMASALWFVGWVVFSEPTRLLGAVTPVACVPIVLATVSAALAAGLTLIIVLRAVPPRSRLALLGAGVIGVTGGGLGLSAGLCQAGPGMAATGAALLSAGLLAVAVAVHRVELPGQGDGDRVGGGGADAVVA
ncbi:GGDEF-domain containing protein, partial [Micromonospora sp. NPDC003776]